MCFLDPRVRSCSFCDKHIKHHTPHFLILALEIHLFCLFVPYPINSLFLEGAGRKGQAAKHHERPENTRDFSKDA